MNAQVMRWKKPRSLEEWEWREQAGGEQCRRVCRFFWKRGFLLGLPTLIAVWQWVPEDFPRVAYSLLGMVAGYSVLLPLQVWACHKVGTGYCINRRGLWHHRSSSRLLNWRDVAGYSIEDHPDVAGVRILTVHWFKRKKPWRAAFDPTGLREEDLVQLLVHHAGDSAK